MRALGSDFDRVRWCGRKRIAEQVALVSGQRATGFSGVAYCGSIHACAVCAAPIRQTRALEIERAAVLHVDRDGGSLAFATITLPHDRTDTLAELLPMVLDGWRWVLRQKAVRQALRRLGYVGAIKALEVTYGAGAVGVRASGWHPHLHVLLFLGPGVTPDAIADLEGVIHAVWVRWAIRNEWRQPGRGVGVLIKPTTTRYNGVAHYLAKVQDASGVDRHVAQEIARADAKRGRGKGLAPFELLHRSRARRLAGDNRGRGRDVALWQEYCAATKGRRAICWTRGLKDRFGIRARTDEDVLAEALSEGMSIRLVMNRWEWLAVTRADARNLLCETYDVAGLRASQALVAALLDEDRQASAAMCTDPGGDDLTAWEAMQPVSDSEPW